MELESSYNLLSVIRDDGIRTYRAIEIASGQELQVHLFAKPESESDRALFKALRALPVSKRRELLEIGMEGNMPYVVTDKLSDSVTAREWLTKFSGLVSKPSGSVFLAGSWKTGTPIPDELLRASHSSPPPVPPAPKREAELSADYTRVMRVPQTLSSPPPSADTTPEPVSAEPVISRASEVSQKPQPVLPPEPPTPASQPPVEEQDDFARMFGSMPAPAVTPAAPHSEPGEFTRMFLATQPPEPPPAVIPAAPPQAVQSPTPAISAAPAVEPGEFTRQFLAVQPPPAPIQSEPPADAATRLYQAVQPPAPPPPLQTDAPPSVQPPPVQPSSDEPTRLFQAVTPSTPPPPPVLTPQPQAGREPGEFTRMFPSAVQPGSPVGPGNVPDRVPDPPAKPGPSEFTRFFQSPMHPAPAGNQSVVSSTPAPQQVSRPSAQPSEFTQMFGNPNKPASTPPSEYAFGSRQPVSGAPSSATGVFSVGKPSPPRASIKASNSALSGPGEFTRMMSASAPATLGQPLAQSNAPEPKAKANILLYIAGGAVLLAIILIIVFFALRH